MERQDASLNTAKSPTGGAGWREVARVLPVLFVVRWGAWAIALIRVAFGDLPDDQTRYEPLLLLVTLAQSLATAVYVPFLRPQLPGSARVRFAAGKDLVALGLVDVAAVLAVVYFAGGFRTPYEEYIYASLLVPAFLLDRRGAALLAAGFLAAFFAVISLQAGTVDGPWFHESVSRFAALIVVPVLVVVVVQYLSELSQTLREQREQARAALAENVRLQREREELAAQEERSRIAREIHDGIAQSIYMLTLNLEKAAEVASNEPGLARRLADLVGLAKEALLEVRYYIFDLKPLLSGDVGLSATIRSQVQEFSAVSGLPVQLAVEGEERPLPLALSTSLYRIAQEALANVYRHAEASNILVRLTYGVDSVSLEVEDDGRGFEVASAGKGGRGLSSMRQRIQELGGRLDIASALGNGASLRVTLPIEVA